MTIKKIFESILSLDLSDNALFKHQAESLIDNVEKNIEELSDGYHTFAELYEYRKLYNAAFFNELAKKSRVVK